ncbi:hypothetical protein ACFXDH_34090 [Streptomyces sp. NPDC059467]|uniref:hypothetical protein n=1 Tax=Streptomyces sp. NPDC059467 TaxID=3346844 RepID=UPI00369C2B6D
MIDEEWLDAQLHYEIAGGYRLNGCRVGGSGVAIFVDHPDGQEMVWKFGREMFREACYFREIPNSLAPRPLYDMDRLNRKLRSLLGDPQLPHVVTGYRDVFRSFLESLLEADAADFEGIRGRTEDMTRRLRFVLQSPPFSYLLEEIVSNPREPRGRQQWAERALESLGRLGEGDARLRPDSLLDNPLFVWGGAALAGYFTKAELPVAAAAALEQFDTFDEEQRYAFAHQTAILVDLLTQIVGNSLRLRLFCDATGLFGRQFTTAEERSEPDRFMQVTLEGL